MDEAMQKIIDDLLDKHPDMDMMTLQMEVIDRWVAAGHISLSEIDGWASEIKHYINRKRNVPPIIALEMTMAQAVLLAAGLQVLMDHLPYRQATFQPIRNLVVSAIKEAGGNNGR